jgi:hypothetical protein
MDKVDIRLQNQTQINQLTKNDPLQEYLKISLQPRSKDIHLIEIRIMHQDVGILTLMKTTSSKAHDGLE